VEELIECGRLFEDEEEVGELIKEAGSRQRAGPR
jgi:hypothetical protein